MKIILVVLLCATVAFAIVPIRTTTPAPATTAAATTAASVQNDTNAKKPGECPDRRYFARPICNGDQDEECKTDSDCKEEAKCCFNGCGMECMPPVIKRPRSAPTTAAATTVAATTVAATTAAPTTVAPSTAAPTTVAATTAAATTAAATTASNKQKPGKCPDRRYFARPICNGDQDEECKNDYDCKEEAKCCFNGCGMECMAPLDRNPKSAPTTVAPTTAAPTTAAATTAAATTASTRASCKNVLCGNCEKCKDGKCVEDNSGWLCRNKRDPCAGFNCPASRECKLRNGRPECVLKEVPKGKGKGGSKERD